MAAEKVSRRTIVLWNGQIDWHLREWRFVHGRRLSQNGFNPQVESLSAYRSMLVRRDHVV